MDIDEAIKELENSKNIRFSRLMKITERFLINLEIEDQVIILLKYLGRESLELIYKKEKMARQNLIK
ncbi:hypothetical protein [Crocosphaera watsonii]|uniref:Uncharacterized protein n=1 Tax=Crocosphaera watsonii WH 0401 TaxID=555881 RepID=T2JD88_CROWT|nr:hypothetical protein [Crocosphaera watsonii]CCQ62452.1 hypothetical protein CWATWH0401_2429 [Crocosphaera watsonii WH 0401]